MAQQQQSEAQVWLEYTYHKHHPAIQWLSMAAHQACRVDYQQHPRQAGLPQQGRSQEGVDAGRAGHHSAKPRGEESGWLRLDNILVCGMGVQVVQVCYACKMPQPVEYTQALFSQNEPAGYP